MYINPHQAIQTLIISSREEQAERLADAIRKGRDTSYLGTVKKADEALVAVSEQWPDAIIIDDPVFGATTPGLVQDILKVHPSAIIIVIAAPDALSIVQRAMVSGARGFLLRPVEANDLVTTIGQLYDLEHARGADNQGTGAHQLRRGEIIAVTGLKGGVGRTMIATNLALALRRNTASQDQVLVLVDAHLEKGDCATHLNLQPSFTIADLVNRFNEVDHDMVEGVLTSHSTGLKLLAAPLLASSVIQIPAYQMEHILNCAQDIADYVIVDMGPTLTEANLLTLDMADIVLVVTMPEIPALLHTKAFLELTQERQYPADKTHVILNRADMRGGIAAAEIEEHLDIRLAATLPDDGGLVAYSINQGVPLILSNERSEVARGIATLAAELSTARHDGPSNGRKAGLMNVFDRLGTVLQRKDQPGGLVSPGPQMLGALGSTS